MTDKELCDALHAYYISRDAFKEVKTELIATATNFGLPQQDALRGAAPDFLYGYLRGKGFFPNGEQP
jgi:hypothetical protein